MAPLVHAIQSALATRFALATLWGALLTSLALVTGTLLVLVTDTLLVLVTHKVLVHVTA